MFDVGMWGVWRAQDPEQQSSSSSILRLCHLPPCHVPPLQMDDCEHQVMYAETTKHLPERLPIDGVILRCLLEFDGAHLQGHVPLSPEILQSTYYKQHANGSSCQAKAALLLREDSPGLTVGAEASCDIFQHHFACAGYDLNRSLAVPVGAILPLVEDFERGALPLLWGRAR